MNKVDGASVGPIPLGKTMVLKITVNEGRVVGSYFALYSKFVSFCTHSAWKCKNTE